MFLYCSFRILCSLSIILSQFCANSISLFSKDVFTILFRNKIRLSVLESLILSSNTFTKGERANLFGQKLRNRNISAAVSSVSREILFNLLLGADILIIFSIALSFPLIVYCWTQGGNQFFYLATRC